MWATGPVWTGAENLAPTEIRSPDRPAPSQSLYQLNYPAHMLVEGKVKVHPRTGHEDPEGEEWYSSTLSLISAPDGKNGQRHAPAALPPGKARHPLYRRLGGPRAGLENLALNRIRSPDRPARSESLYRLSYPGPRLMLV